MCSTIVLLNGLRGMVEPAPAMIMFQ